MPDDPAGPSNPIVTYVSSAISGAKLKNAGLIPEALQLELYEELKAPSGVDISNGAWLFPNTALILSVGLTISTKILYFVPGVITGSEASTVKVY